MKIYLDHDIPNGILLCTKNKRQKISLSAFDHQANEISSSSLGRLVGNDDHKGLSRSDFLLLIDGLCCKFSSEDDLGNMFFFCQLSKITTKFLLNFDTFVVNSMRGRKDSIFFVVTSKKCLTSRQTVCFLVGGSLCFL